MASNRKAATLINLEDEYLKARSDTKAKSQAPSSHKKLKDIIHYKKAEKEKKQAERSAKEKKRAERLALTEKEEQDLANSRSVLEAKSAVYDKLLTRQGESSDNILVDFSQKRIEGQEIPFDYSSRRSQDSDIERKEESEEEYDEVHLSHVDKGEVRRRGVGFYSFSKDPETRKQQMDFLNSMRESTERSRELFLAAKKKRKQEKLDRLNRLRKKLRLEPLTRLPNDKLTDDETPDEEDAASQPPDTAPNESASRDPTKSGGPNKSGDLAKSIEEKFLVREQTLWERKVEELREEREMEFAPAYGGHVIPDEEELGEEDDAIVNFISFVRHNT